jgi:hypothetical protein
MLSTQRPPWLFLLLTLPLLLALEVLGESGVQQLLNGRRPYDTLRSCKNIVSLSSVDPGRLQRNSRLHKVFATGASIGYGSWQYSRRRHGEGYPRSAAGDKGFGM